MSSLRVPRRVVLSLVVAGSGLSSYGESVAVLPVWTAGVLLVALGEHSFFPSPGGFLGGELLYDSEVVRASSFPLPLFRLVRQSCVFHKDLPKNKSIAGHLTRLPAAVNGW